MVEGKFFNVYNLNSVEQCVVWVNENVEITLGDNGWYAQTAKLVFHDKVVAKLLGGNSMWKLIPVGGKELRIQGGDFNIIRNIQGNHHVVFW